ncbi:hypothetical protein HDV57DRAFT_293898 [Trichoderma longibrachiatum]
MPNAIKTCVPVEIFFCFVLSLFILQMPPHAMPCHENWTKDVSMSARGAKNSPPQSVESWRHLWAIVAMQCQSAHKRTGIRKPADYRFSFVSPFLSHRLKPRHGRPWHHIIGRRAPR